MSFYGNELKEAILSGCANLEAKKEYINELNVFPVPDGDTGTNMSMTMRSVVTAMEQVEDVNISNICKAVASGSLRGARGNSGVIMSQLLRGFTNTIADAEVLSMSLVCNAFVKASETAYKAVMKPKEGTILTVSKGLATKASELKDSDKDYIEVFEEIVRYGYEVLDDTPNMLPVLKEAGVVDSGGQGLMSFLSGVLSYLKGEEITYEVEVGHSSTGTPRVEKKNLEKTKLTFHYCTEMLINNEKGFPADTESSLKSFFEEIGDSIVVVVLDGIIKVHVHTDHPGLVFERGLQLGYLSDLKVDNLMLEHNEVLIKNASEIAGNKKANKKDASKDKKDTSKTKEEKKKEPTKDFGFVSVASGVGMTELFKELGVDYVISGGQTMNPSTDDIINAVEDVDAKNIFVLPNNGNIILAAKQAKELIEDKNVFVVETKNVCQGISAMLSFMPDKDPEKILSSMTGAAKGIKVIEVTYAVRDTTIDDISVKKDDYICLGDNGLLYTHKSITDSILGALQKITSDSDELATIYYGADVNEEDAKQVADAISKKYPNLEVECHKGDQAVYYYYISIE